MDRPGLRPEALGLVQGGERRGDRRHGQPERGRGTEGSPGQGSDVLDAANAAAGATADRALSGEVLAQPTRRQLDEKPQAILRRLDADIPDLACLLHDPLGEAEPVGEIFEVAGGGHHHRVGHAAIDKIDRRLDGESPRTVLAAPGSVFDHGHRRRDRQRRDGASQVRHDGRRNNQPPALIPLRGERASALGKAFYATLGWLHRGRPCDLKPHAEGPAVTDRGLRQVGDAPRAVKTGQPS